MNYYSPLVVREKLAPGIVRHWELSAVAYHRRTPIQEVIIGTSAQGVGLFCDGERQSTELSQQIYHEAQFVPAATLLGREPRRVLVLGSSEGVVSLMARDAGAVQVDHVDIDLACVEACAENLPYGYTPAEVAAALACKGPVRLFIEDGVQYVERAVRTGCAYDIIVMDLPDEVEGDENAQQNRLYGADFTGQIRRLLAPDGVFITQAGCPTYWRNATLRQAWRRMRNAFPTVVYFQMDEHEWAWIAGRNDVVADPVGVMRAMLPRLRVTPKFIDDESLIRSTMPPIGVRRNLGGTP